MSHTPGPWRKHGGFVFFDHEDYSGEFLATYRGPQGPMGMKSSDARLIAAAPDLLDACASALRLLRNSGFTDNVETISKLNAAIAKAEGSDEKR